MVSPSHEPRWLDRLVVDAIHHDMITTHGGLPGLREEALLDSALARPQQVFSYGTGVDVAALAAAYAYGISRNHPFQDGNKRMAFMVMAVFAEMNGLRLSAPETDVVQTMLALASGELEEADLAEWLRSQSAADDKISSV